MYTTVFPTLDGFGFSIGFSNQPARLRDLMRQDKGVKMAGTFAHDSKGFWKKPGYVLPELSECDMESLRFKKEPALIPANVERNQERLTFPIQNLREIPDDQWFPAVFKKEYITESEQETQRGELVLHYEEKAERVEKELRGTPGNRRYAW